MNLIYPRKLFRRYSSIKKEIDEIINKIRQASPIGLHLGAGENRIPGLINCDLFNETADKKVDCINLKEFQDDSIDLIETHHLIEHLSFSDVNKALKEWTRVMKPGGYLIITCPDMAKITLNMVGLSLKHFFKVHRKKDDYLLKIIYGTQEHEGMFHKSGYNRFILSNMLTMNGFSPEFFYTRYPPRSTPSLLVIAKKRCE